METGLTTRNTGLGTGVRVNELFIKLSSSSLNKLLCLFLLSIASVPANSYADYAELKQKLQTYGYSDEQLKAFLKNIEDNKGSYGLCSKSDFPTASLVEKIYSVQEKKISASEQALSATQTSDEEYARMAQADDEQGLFEFEKHFQKSLDAKNLAEKKLKEAEVALASETADIEKLTEVLSSDSQFVKGVASSAMALSMDGPAKRCESDPKARAAFEEGKKLAAKLDVPVGKNSFYSPDETPLQKACKKYAYHEALKRALAENGVGPAAIVADGGICDTEYHIEKERTIKNCQQLEFSANQFCTEEGGCTTSGGSCESIAKAMHPACAWAGRLRGKAECNGLNITSQVARNKVSERVESNKNADGVDSDKSDEKNRNGGTAEKASLI